MSRQGAGPGRGTGGVEGTKGGAGVEPALGPGSL